MRASDANGNARLTIEPRGNWEYSSYQTDNQFVVEVRPVKDDPNKLIAGQGYRGERLSLNFQNIDIRSLLQVFADFTNLNIITSDTVQGNLTLRLQGRAVGPGAPDRDGFEGSGLAPQRQRAVGGAQGGTGDQGEAGTPEAAAADRRSSSRSAARSPSSTTSGRTMCAACCWARAPAVRAPSSGWRGLGGAAGTMGATRMLSKRGSLTADPAYQPAVRVGRGEQARGSAELPDEDRHPGAPGDH